MLGHMTHPQPPGSGAAGSAVVLFDAKGRILLQQRSDDQPPEGVGRWSIPGGGSEPGDVDFKATALREFEEETGLRLERLRFFASYTPDTVPGLIASTLNLFFADDEVDPATIQVNEGLDFRFWSPEEAAALPMNPPGREILRQLEVPGDIEQRCPYRFNPLGFRRHGWYHLPPADAAPA